MEYIICKFISSNRKAIRKEAYPKKRKHYDRLATISSLRLLEIASTLQNIFSPIILIINKHF